MYALVPFVPGPPSPRHPRGAPMPLGLDQGGNAVHLGRRRALIWTPQEIRDRRAIPLCDDGADRLLHRRRRHLQALLPDRRLGPQLRFGEMVGWSLKTPPRGTWGRLLPHLGRAQREVWLGPGGVGRNLLWRQDADVRGPHSKDIQDTFNRANAALAGSNSSDAQFTWSLAQGSGTINADIVSNQLLFGIPSGSDIFGVCLPSLAMDTADHYAQVDFIGADEPASPAAIEVAVRITNGTGVSDSGYAIALTSGARTFYNFVTGATIASDGTTTTSGLLYLELSGSTYTVKVAGSTIFTGTDTTFPGSGAQRKTTINAFISGSSRTITADSFRAADLAGGPSNTNLSPTVGVAGVSGVTASRVVGTVSTPLTP